MSEIKENQHEKMTCKCGKEFECYHKFTFPEYASSAESGIVINHSRKCSRGKWDFCKGECSDCFVSPEAEFEKAKREGKLFD